jgi:hypothetical protein
MLLISHSRLHFHSAHETVQCRRVRQFLDGTLNLKELELWLYFALVVYLRRTNSCTSALASRPPALISVLEKTNPGPRLLGG